MVRAKMRCSQINITEYGRTITLHAVYGKENESWAKATPGGNVTMTITNPDAYEQFKLGETYFVDFTPAPATEAGEAK
jgi:hypothetical protein